MFSFIFLSASSEFNGWIILLFSKIRKPLFTIAQGFIKVSLSQGTIQTPTYENVLTSTLLEVAGLLFLFFLDTKASNPKSKVPISSK